MKHLTEEQKIKAIHYLAKKLQEKKLKEYGLEVDKKKSVKGEEK